MPDRSLHTGHMGTGSFPKGKAVLIIVWQVHKIAMVHADMCRFFLALRPRAIIGDRRHDRDAAGSYQQLSNDPAGSRFQNKIPDERKVDSDAEHLERLLAAFD